MKANENKSVLRNCSAEVYTLKFILFLQKNTLIIIFSWDIYYDKVLSEPVFMFLLQYAPQYISRIHIEEMELEINILTYHDHQNNLSWKR